MKLRNKKTREMGEARLGNREIYVDTDDKTYCYVKDIDKFCKEWECAESAEPLIKDEKIRKAVRAWAEACGLTYVTYKQASNEFYDANTRGAFAIKFRLIPVEVYLDDCETYTIAELCGEEEE